MKITKKQIEKVLSGFNFDQAAQIYQQMNWTWWGLGGSSGKVPNSDEIRQTAIRLLEDLRKSPNAESIRSGGLKVSRYYEDKLSIVKLELVALSSVHDNLD